MYARFTTGQAQPGRLDEAIAIFRDSVVPAMKQQRGNQGGTLAVDRQTGKFIAVSYWETEADMQGTNESSAYLKEIISKVTPLLAGPLSIENYEVSVMHGEREGTYVRITTGQIIPAKIEESQAILRDSIAEIARQPGFKVILSLTDATTGKARVGTVWATEADRQRFQESGIADQHRSRFSGVLAQPLGQAEDFEVVFRA